MKSKRNVFAALSLALLLVTSGCIGFLTGSEAQKWESSAATVSDQALEETDYDEKSVAPNTINESFTVAEQERQVQVTNWIAEYDRSVSFFGFGEKRAAVFVAVSTPQIELAGKSFNPAGEMDNAELAEQLTSQYDDINNVQEVETRNATMLGKSTEVSKFEATTEMNGQQIDVYLHVTSIEHGDDYVLAISVYPQQLDGEEERAFTLLESIEHPDE